jgi:molybdate transport system substrate-binding protein
MRPILFLLVSSALVAAASAEMLTMSVAASLRDVAASLVKTFEEAHPGAQVAINSGASGMLARQIEEGGPVDVFVSAGRPEIQRLQTKELVLGEPVVVARNRLVLIVPKDSPWTGKDARTVLTSPDVKRIASGDPATVPFGAYAKQALQASGLWAQVEPKLVFAADVRQALTYADERAVDVAIVYATDARIAKSAVILGDVPGADGLRIEAVAARTKHGTSELAKALLAVWTGPKTRAALAEAGFLAP